MLVMSILNTFIDWHRYYRNIDVIDVDKSCLSICDVIDSLIIVEIYLNKDKTKYKKINSLVTR